MPDWPLLKSITTCLPSKFLTAVTLLLLMAYTQAAKAQFTLERLNSLLQRQTITTTEALMANLPKGIRSNYVLVYSTRNKLQPATPMQPRVILHNATGSFLMAFAGGENPVKRKTVEIINFNESRNAFDFKTIEFDSDSGTVTFNEHPKACIGCHEEHPIWDNYPNWPGIYGSSDFSEMSKEEGIFRQFLNTSAKEGIYKYLGGLQRKSISSLTKSNGLITNMFSKLNFEVILRDLRSNPRFEEFRPALLAAIYDYPNFLNFLPKDQTRDSSRASEFKQFQENARVEINSYLRNAESRLAVKPYGKRLDFSLAKKEFNLFTNLAFVMKQMGLDLSRRATLFRSNALAFTTASNIDALIESRFLDDWKNDDTELLRKVSSRTDKVYPFLASIKPRSDGFADVRAESPRPRCETILLKARRLISPW